LAGYLIEESLSVDNLFVFLLIFSYFRVPLHDQHSVLFWGIIGVLVMRAVFIALGITLINSFHWVIYIFGAMLVITGVRLAFEKDKKIEPEKDIVLRIFKRFMPVTEQFEGDKYFVRRNGRLWATPLFVVLLVIDVTDLIFAMDSIPAVLAITQDPFIVYTSNIFAIMGLRSLYFVIANMFELFHHLHYGLAVILIFVGCKMLLSHYFEISIITSLLIILSALALSIVASMIWPSKHKHTTNTAQ